MAGSRTLKLSILAETKDLVDGLKKAETSTQSFGDKATEFGKKAALAFAVAGAAVLAFAADSVKAAAEDAAAQEKLNETIKATTGATAAQVKGVEDYITKTSIAIGVTDDQLRPAFGRLVRSTKDVDEAQRLLNLALDLAVVTGKPVETVANALGKAYDGNTVALGKLGLGLDANLLKSKDNQAIIESLETTYGRFAEGAAETAAVKFERIRIATEEAKESIGAALLPVVEELSDYVLSTVVPNLESFINALTGQGSLQEATENGTEGAYQFGEQVKKVSKTIISLKDELIGLAAVIGTIFVVSKISAGITATIALITTLIGAYNRLKTSSIVAGIAAAFALNPILGVAAVAAGAAVLAGATALANRYDTSTTAAPSTGSIPFASGFGAPTAKSIKAAGVENVVEMDNQGRVTSVNGVKVASEQAAQAALGITNFNAGQFRVAESASMGSPTINLTVNGAIDKEGTARTIVQTLNDSFYRGTTGAGALVS